MRPTNESLDKVLLFLVALIVLSLGLICQTSRLLNAYRSSPLHLEADPEFGADTDWNTTFYHLFCDIVVAPDGSIFVASTRQQKVFKFNKNGTLIKAFGQKGQGPGDFNVPSELSILDGKWLIVGEYSLNHRISVFDLDGNFVKLLKTKHYASFPTALSGGKIAYIATSTRPQKNSRMEVTDRIFIKDMDSGGEIQVRAFSGVQHLLKLKTISLVFMDTSRGSTFLNRTRDGNLMVGNSQSREIEIYSPSGKKVGSFTLNMEPIPVTGAYIKKYKDDYIRNLGLNSQGSQDRIKELRNSSINHVFSRFLNYYKEILTDSDGNFLVFKKTDCLGECPIVFQVYSPQGDYVCEVELKEGPFLLSIDPRLKNMCFTEYGLIALVEVKDAEEFELRMIKVSFQLKSGGKKAQKVVN